MTVTAFDHSAPEAATVSRAIRSVRRTGTRRSRPIEKGPVLAVAGIAVAVIGGFAGAMTLLSGLAGPPPRPVIVMNTGAAEWPDLRDGVPALARPSDAPSRVAADPSRDAAPPAATPVALRAAIDPVVPAATQAPQVAAKAAKPAGQLPQIENAALVAPMREASLVVSMPRSAALVRPLVSETVKARTAAASAFTALEPEDTTASVAEPARDIVAQHRETVKPRVKAASVKPARAAATEASTAAATTEAADADETEVLGVKIPSLAATGRKLREAFVGPDSSAPAASQ